MSMCGVQGDRPRAAEGRALLDAGRTMDCRSSGDETAGLDPASPERRPMRNRTRAIAVGVSLAASVLLLHGSAVGAGTGDDRGGHTMTFHVLFQPFNYTDLGA